MLKRVLVAALAAVAVTTTAGTTTLAAGPGTAAAPAVQAAPQTAPTFSCEPGIVSTVCQTVFGPICKDRCMSPQAEVGAPAATTGTASTSRSATAATPNLFCQPSVQIVCTVLGATVCRKSPCGIDANTTAAATETPAMPCAPSVQCWVAWLTGNCPARCAGTASASAPMIYCDVPVVCLVLALTVCRHGCYAAPAETAATPASLPGDPCSRNWGQPIETICRL